jgi:hypothetical protein
MLAEEVSYIVVVVGKHRRQWQAVVHPLYQPVVELVCVCVCVCVYVPCMRMFVRKCMHTQALLYINRNTIKPTIYVCKCKYMRVYEDKHRSDNIHKFYHQLIPSDRFADIHIPFSSFSNT